MKTMPPEQLIAIGEQLQNTGHWQEAEERFTQALESAKQLGDLRWQTIATSCLASLFLKRGDLTLALKLYNQGLELAERSGTQLLIGLIYNGMGLAHNMQSNYPQAIAFFEKSAKIAEQSNQLQGLAVTYGNLGII